MKTTSLVRRAVASTLLLALTVGVSSTSVAQTVFPKPGKPIRLIIPFSPGGVTDTSGRLIGERLAQRLGVQVVPDNRPGASGSIGTSAVVSGEPDGHTLLLALDGSLVINPHTIEKLSSFNPTRDLSAVGKIGDSTIILVANPSVKARTLSEVIALSKSQPGGLSYGTSGAGSIVHIAAELLAERSGAVLVHVPYKGGGLAVSDVLAGHIPLAFVSAASVQAYIKSGKLNAIAVPSGKRSPSFPEVPTFAENGVKDFDVNSWVGLMAPPKTPAAIVAKLNSELNAILSDPEVQTKLNAMGITGTPGTSQAFAKAIDSDFVLFGKVAKTAGIKVD